MVSHRWTDAIRATDKLEQVRVARVESDSPVPVVDDQGSRRRVLVARGVVADLYPIDP